MACSARSVETPAVRTGTLMKRRGALVPAAVAARKLGVHRVTIIRWVKARKVAGVSVPRHPAPGQRRRYYVFRSALAELLSEGSD